MQIGAVYEEGRQRIVEVVSGLDQDRARAPVPTCPDWTVADVLAHLTGVCADVLAGRLDGVATDPWTEAQVSARRGRPVDELVAEWDDVAPQVEAIAEQFPERTGEQWVTDLTTHEHDIRTAVGTPGARDAAGVAIGLDFAIAVGFDPSIAARGLPGIEIRAADNTWRAGDAELAGMLEATPFELLRALTGRRSRAQIRSLGWSIDPEPYLDAFAFGPFTPSPTDIEE